MYFSRVFDTKFAETLHLAITNNHLVLLRTSTSNCYHFLRTSVFSRCAMRRKPGVAGLIREKEQQSAINAVGEKLEERRVWEGVLVQNFIIVSCSSATMKLCCRPFPSSSNSLGCLGIRRRRTRMPSSCCKVFRLLSGTLPRDIVIVSWMGKRKLLAACPICQHTV